MRKVLLSVFAVASLAACTSSPSASTQAPATKPSTPTNTEVNPPVTEQKPATETGPYAATQTDPSAFPQVANSGGSVVASPKVMPIYFDGYTYRAKLDSFHEKLQGSKYWNNSVSEYGVGALSVLPGVTISGAAPASISDDGIQTWLKSKFTDGTLGTPDQDIAYAVYYPKSTTVTLDGDRSCSSFGGYHSEVNLGGGKKVGYAVIPTCDEASLYITASHEYVEWATDRFPYTAAAYQQMEPKFAMFGLLAGGEISDVCTFLEGTQAQALGKRTSGYVPEDIGFTVQRHFSNKLSAAGHFPCAPDYNGTFLVAIPQLTESYPVGQFGGNVDIMTTTDGSGEIKLKIHSDKAVSEPWRLFASALSMNGGQAKMNVKLDKTKVVPGDEVTLTISDSQENQAGIMLITSNGTDAHSWPVLVVGQ